MEGHIFVICGPSGVGKGTLINMLFDEFPNFVVPSSYTTRQPRINEGTRKKYHFVTRQEFMQAVKDDKILEYEEEHGNLYGTDKESITEAIDQDKMIVVDIEPRGALTFRRLYNDKTTIIFVAPPSIESLRERIKNDARRANITQVELSIRLETAKREIDFAPQADYIVENKDGQVDKAYQKLTQIIKNKQKETHLAS